MSLDSRNYDGFRQLPLEPSPAGGPMRAAGHPEAPVNKRDYPVGHPASSSDADVVPRLGRGLLRFFELLRRVGVGATLSEEYVLEQTGWSANSLKTYERKNKLTPFLSRESNGQFKVLQGGRSLREVDVASALSQVTSEPLKLTGGEKLTSQRGRYTLLSKLGNGAVGHVWEARVVDHLKPRLFGEKRRS